MHSVRLHLLELCQMLSYKVMIIHYAGRVSAGEGVDKTRAVCGLGPAGGLHGTRQLDGQLLEV